MVICKVCHYGSNSDDTEPLLPLERSSSSGSASDESLPSEEHSCLFFSDIVA